MNNEKIPRLIHYCWFGGNEKPENIKKYMKTWDKLDDFKIIEWSEVNSKLDSNSFVQKAYTKRKWAYVSDYVRLKVLYDYGGIYLDTDVEVTKNFDQLLQHDMFLGFIYDCSIGTAVIGAKPKHPVIKELLNLYEEVIYDSNDEELGFKLDNFTDEKLINNNDLFTLYLLKNFPDFRLNNQYQELNNLVIYPKEYFEIQPIFGSKFSIHRCEGSLNTKGEMNVKFKNLIKSVLLKVPLINMNALITHINYKRKVHKLPFYSYYLEHKK